MNRSLALLCLAAPLVFLRADEPRKPNPFAPSLNELTDEEEKKLDEIIDRFVQFDTGKLRGPEGQQAARDFAKLGPDSIPALLRGLNRVSNLNHSCPVTMIAGKLDKLLGASNDPKLLDFARDEMAGVAQSSQHRVIVQNLRFAVTQRRNALARAGITGNPPPKGPRTLSTSQLIEEAGKERGERLRQMLLELGQRSGDEVLNTLGVHAASYEKETQTTARTALVTVVTKLKPDEVKKKLTDEKAEVRLAALKVSRNRDYRFGAEFVERLNDEDPNVREWAQTNLIKLAKGVDYGPPKNASTGQRQQAMERWRAWWEKQSGR